MGENAAKAVKITRVHSVAVHDGGRGEGAGGGLDPQLARQALIRARAILMGNVSATIVQQIREGIIQLSLLLDHDVHPELPYEDWGRLVTPTLSRVADLVARSEYKEMAALQEMIEVLLAGIGRFEQGLSPSLSLREKAGLDVAAERVKGRNGWGYGW